MGNASDKTAYYRLDIQGNARQFSSEASSSMKELAEKIANANQVIREMSNANRNLKGDSDAVKNAKEKLSAAIQSEKSAVVAANLELLKQGATYERVVNEVKLAERARVAAAAAESLALQREAVEMAKAAAAADLLAKKEAKLAETKAAKEAKAVADAHMRLKDAVASVGGPVSDASSRLSSLSSILEAASSSAAILIIGVTAVVAAVTAATVAIVGATLALSKWIIETSSMQKSEQLTREAFSGTASNAANLGTQVALLASKVPTSTAALNDLATQLMRTRLSGDTVVDAFNAISQASAAAGPEVGKQIEDWITRGQRWGRMQLNPLEMQNTGIMFKDVAREYATAQRIGFDQAQKELFIGTAKLSAGATALRTVVERQFANINAQKMLTLDHITETWAKHLRTLTTGVDFTKIAGPLGEIMNLFDASTGSGKALKSMVESLGTSIGEVFHAAVPWVQDFVEKAEILSLRAILKFYDVRDAIREMTGDKKALTTANLFRDALYGVGAAAAAVAVPFALLAFSMATIMVPFAAIAAIVTAVGYGLVKLVDALPGYARTVVDYWSGIGKSMMEGLVNGILGTAQRVAEAVVKVASMAKQAFTGALEIHSPSRVFAEYGRQTTAGYMKGLDETAGNAQRSVDKMAPSAPASGGGSHVGGASFVVNINVNSGPGGEQIAATLSSPSFLGQLMHEIEHVLQSQGVPTQTLVTP